MTMHGLIGTAGSAVSFAKAGGSLQKLMRERARLAWSLSALVLIMYYAFVYVVAFKPSWLATKIGATGVTVGLPIVGGMFVVFWLLTAIYSYRANTRLDTLVRMATDEVYE
jgi:uncharacterized membrane protein (DUF485 family)